MLKRRVPRVLATGVLLAVSVAGLSACRTSPNVAAYVGDAQVTVTELDSAVAERMADEKIAAYAEGNEDQFTRGVLGLLVKEEVYSAAAERYDVQVDNEDVRARIAELLGQDDPDAVYGQLAQQGIGREDVFENVRQQLLRQRIAAAAGKAGGLDDAALRARYAEVRDDLGQVSYGYIVVPDEATADTVLAQLTADPASYPAVAAQYPGASLPALVTQGPDKFPSALAEGITAAAPNTGFITPVRDAAVVTFVAGPVIPTFEEVRPDLEKEAADQAEQAANSILDDVRKDLGVTVNPRFGVLQEGKLVAGGGDLVDILGDGDDTTAPAAAPAK